MSLIDKNMAEQATLRDRLIPRLISGKPHILDAMAQVEETI